jgi:fumarate reductase iron-sulfur subunit
MEKQEMSRMKVLRFDPDKNPSSFFQDYLIPFAKENTILDALYYIYRHLDGTLAFRGSCFAGGWCNVCAVKVNGKVLLPCKHFLEKEMVIEPLPGYPVLRDLIVDYSAKRMRRVDSNEPGKD